MAEPMTAQQFLDQLKKFGVKVHETEGWRTHNRNHKGEWGPLNGVMVHHTAGLNVLDYVINGSSDLPGPLCHGYIDKKGTVHLVGWGRANHAGGGDPQVLEAVKAEAAALPKTNEHQGSDGAVDGNPHFVGFECENKGDGNDPWPAAQLAAMQKASAAVCDFYGWTARSVIRHLDWSDWKSDPKGVDWKKFQAAVQKLLDGAQSPSQPQPDPKPLPTVSLKAAQDAARRDPAAPQGSASHRTAVLLIEKALAACGFLDHGWVDGSYGTRTITAYQHLQRHLGYTGGDADGIPGSHSLTWLGQRSKLFTKAD